MRLIKLTLVLFNLIVLNIIAQTTDPTPPDHVVNLVMIHQSIGRGWLHTYQGDLGGELGRNNYYVSDVESQWDAPENASIFSYTYPGAMYYWFVDETIQGNGVPRRDNIMEAVYNYFENWARPGKGWATYDTSLVAYPGGENEVILFKPTHVSSEVKDNSSGSNVSDLIGRPPSDGSYTLDNAKEMYKLYVDYFKAHPEKMFVLITPPPHMQAEGTPAGEAANARTLNTWLVNNWLQELDYENANVYVFDFFNVLTGENNHHRVIGTTGNYSIEYVPGSFNFGHVDYYSSANDPHPENGGGGDKGTKEFVPLLNVYYNRYQDWLNSLSGENPIVTTSVMKTVSVGIEYADTIKASGGDGTYTWSVTGALPEGLTFTSAGIISGTATEGSEGSYALTFNVVDGNGKKGTRDINLSVQGKLSISTTSLNSGLVGANYTSTLKAEGGTAPYSWYLVSDFPSWLSLEVSTGILSGVPTEGYNDSIKVGVNDNGSPVVHDTISILLSVIDEGNTLFFREDSLPNGKVGANYSTELNPVNGVSPYTFTHIAGDSLPSGVTMSASYFGGVPTESGRFVFTIRLEDSGTPSEVYEKEISLVIFDSVDIKKQSNLNSNKFFKTTFKNSDVILHYLLGNDVANKKTYLELFNLSGRKVSRVQLDIKTNQINISEALKTSLSSGRYIISIVTEKGATLFKQKLNILR